MKKRERRKAAEMYPLVVAWERSGQSQSAFCEANGLPLAVFKYWLKHHREKHRGTFQEVSLPAPPACQLEIEFPSGVIMRVALPAAEGYLDTLIKHLC